MYWEKHRDKIIGDSYTHKMLFPQALLFGLILLFSLFSTFFGYSMILILSTTFILLFFTAVIFNLDVIAWIWKKEKTIAILSPFIFLLRNIAGVAGVFVGLIKFLFKKF
jgi:hypothetical protein